MKKEFLAGWALFALLLIFGRSFLGADMLFFRLIAGLALGYALARSYMGFAGSVNRACRLGSTKLMRALMLMFFLTAVVNTGFFLNGGLETGKYNLWVNPINLGLLLGGILFGFGMSLSTCCASGVLTDVILGLPRATVTLFFFMAGVFLGFPIQKTQSFVKKSWFSTETFENGVFLPDLFGGNTVWAYLGAIILTGFFCAIVVYFALQFENKKKRANKYTAVPSEEVRIEAYDTKEPVKLFSKETYNRLFVQSWPLSVGAVSITCVVAVMMGVTKAGWGASTPYGFWFGKLLLMFGVSPESLAGFSHFPAKVYTMPFFAHPINVQNIGIVLGTFIYMLTSGHFTETFKATFKLPLKSAALYSLGGFSMGFGTRLSNGCNVGALYTPIANFSLSGWVFLIFMVIGGVIGNNLGKRANHNPL